MGTQRSATIGSLTNGRTYRFYAVAVNDAGGPQLFWYLKSSWIYIFLKFYFYDLTLIKLLSLFLSYICTVAFQTRHRLINVQQVGAGERTGVFAAEMRCTPRTLVASPYKVGGDCFGSDL